MSSREFEQILQRIAALERRSSLAVRAGTITDLDVKKGVRISWGKETQKKGGGQEQDLKSPWIKPSNHHGFVVEHMPWKKGQTVISIGMDAEHRTALVFPHSPSDANPQDGDASMTAHTYRIRKPSDDKTQQQPQQAQQTPQNQSRQPQQPQQSQKAKDDKEDFTFKREYGGLAINVGEKLSFKISRDGKNIVAKAGGASLTVEDGKITLDAKEVICKGENKFIVEGKSYLGSKDASDTPGICKSGKCAEKVFVK